MSGWTEGTRARLVRSMQGPMGSRAYKRDLTAVLAELDRRAERIAELEIGVRALGDLLASIEQSEAVEKSTAVLKFIQDLESYLRRACPVEHPGETP